MKKQLKLSKVAKVATGAAFLFFCLLNLKTVVNNNGKVEMSNSDEVQAKCKSNYKNNGDCSTQNGKGFCMDSWFWHDCYY
jgi:hypothetical protein